MYISFVLYNFTEFIPTVFGEIFRVLYISCHLQVVMILLLPFQFGYLALNF